MTPPVLDTTAPAGDTWVIEPRRESLGAVAREFWRYRRLMRFFASRSLQKLYARTMLGWTWLFIRPLFPLLVNTFVFSGVLAVKAGDAPYFLFLIVGNAPWDLFSSVVMWGTRSLELNRGLLSRIYLPRTILPVAVGSPAALNFAIQLGVLALALLYYKVTQGRFWLSPATLGWALQATLLSWLLALGISFWTSVPALVARDIRFTLNYVLGFWVFLTPVMYPLSAVPEKYRWIVAMNPMTPAVESFKYGVLGTGSIDGRLLLTAWAVALTVLASGLAFFIRAERSAADKV